MNFCNLCKKTIFNDVDLMTINPDKRVYTSLHDDSQHWLSLMMGGTGLWSSVSMCGAEQCW